MTDSDIATLQNPRIEVLDLSDNKISGKCFKYLNCKNNLINLSLRELPESEFDFAGLQEYARLSNIEFDDNPVSAKTVREFAHIPNLASLDLNRCIIEPDAYQYFSHFPGLRSLSLSETQTRDEHLSHVKGMRHLRQLNLRGTEVTKEGIERLNMLFKEKLDIVAPWHKKQNDIDDFVQGLHSR